MRRDLIFINASQQSAANAACDAAGLGPATFHAGLVPQDRSPGEPPATQYYCCTNFGEQTAGVLDRAGVPYRRHEDSRGPRLDESRGTGMTPEQARASEGVKRIRAQEEV